MAIPTKADILAYFASFPSKTSARLISGQKNDYRDQGVFARIQTATGVRPGLMGIELGDFFTYEDAANYASVSGKIAWDLTEAIAHWNAGGLVHASFLMSHPSTGDQANYLTADSNIGAILGGAALCSPWVAGVHQSGKTFHELLDRQLIAPLTTLKNAGVVVLLRSFFEMNSGFWWGVGNMPSSTWITMHQNIYNYVAAAGLNTHVIWAYSTIAGNGGDAAAYPGSAYVDLVGVDYYSPTGRALAGVGGWSTLQALGKPMCFAELGHQTYGDPPANHDLNVLLADIQTNYPDAVFFMCWTSGNDQIDNATNITAALARSWVANLPLGIPTFVDTINYTSQGGYADLDFVVKGGVYTTPAGLGPRLGKIGGRHVAVDVTGKVLMLRGCMRATNDDVHVIGGGQQAGRTLNSNLATKYAGAGTDWLTATGARLRNFHFNIVGNTSGAFNNGGGELTLFSVGGIFDAMLRPRMQQVIPNAEPIKDLIQAVNFLSGATGLMFGDVFDPKWATFIAGWITVWADPKIFAFWSDDGDHVSAFGGTGHPNEVGFTDPGENYGQHAGMIALIGRLTITSQNNANIGPESWSVDTLNHTKRALLDYLIVKYGTIAALNTAWGTGGFYTSFEPAGGWGGGTGLADEDGARAHAWLGSASPGGSPQNGGPNNLIDSTTWGLAGPLVASTYYPGQVRQMKEDLDVFLFKIFEAYLKPIHDKIKAVRPNALFAGMNGGAPDRAPGLAAINLYCDVLMGGGHYAFGNSHTLNPVAQAQTDYERRTLTIPTFTSIYGACNDDSAMYYLNPNGLDKQAANGARHATIITAAMQYQAPDGSYPYLGYFKWGLYDQPGDGVGVGWGLFSYNDNPYDGRDYRVAIPDPYTPGRTTWAEDRAYGDQLTPIVVAQKAMFTIVQSQFTSSAPVASFTVQQPSGTQSIAFTDTSSGNPVATAWTYTFGDGQTSILQSPTHAYASPGTYNVVHTATNPNGTGTTAPIPVTVAAVQTGWQRVRYVRGSSGAGQSSTPATPAAINVGNLVVVHVDADIGVTGSIAVTDTLGNIYGRAPSTEYSWNPGTGATARVESFWIIATIGGANPIVTATYTNGTTLAYGIVEVLEYAVVGAVPAISLLGETHAAAIGAASPVDPGTLTPTRLALLLGFTSFSATNATAPAGWTVLSAVNNKTFDQLNVVAGTYALQQTYSGTQNWVAQMLAFAATAGGTATVITTAPAALTWTGSVLSLPGIIALTRAALTWTGRDLDIHTVSVGTTVVLAPLALPWTGASLTLPSLLVRRTLIMDNFNRADGPLR